MSLNLNLFDSRNNSYLRPRTGSYEATESPKYSTITEANIYSLYTTIEDPPPPPKERPVAEYDFSKFEPVKYVSKDSDQYYLRPTEYDGGLEPGKQGTTDDDVYLAPTERYGNVEEFKK